MNKFQSGLAARQATANRRREKAIALKKEGWDIKAIARHLNVTTRTIKRDLENLEERNHND